MKGLVGRRELLSRCIGGAGHTFISRSVFIANSGRLTLGSATIQRVSFTAQACAVDQQQLHQDFSNALARFEFLCTKIEESPSIQLALDRSVGHFRNATLKIDEGVKSHISIAAVQPLGDRYSKSRISSNDELRMTVSRAIEYRPKACQCSCHGSQWSQRLGFRSFQLSGFEFSYRKACCYECSCHKGTGHSINVNYCLPTWIAGRMLKLWFSSSPLHGPECGLRMPRMISDPSPIIQAVSRGDLETFKCLVAQGEGSSHDVDEAGNSFLTVCGGCFHIFKALLPTDI